MLFLSNRSSLLLILVFIISGIGRKTTTTTTVFVAARPRRKDGHPSARSVRLINRSGVLIDMYWIHPDTRELADSNTRDEGIAYGSESDIGSYIGHEFEVRELPDKNKKCSKEPKEGCQKAYFTVGSTEDQWFTIDKNFSITMEDSNMRSLKRAKESLSKCQLDTTLSATPEQQIEEYSKCLEERVDYELKTTQEEITFQAKVRKEMGDKLKNYMCIDDDRNNATTTTTSPSIQNNTYAGTNSQVQILFESDYSSVRIYKDFLRDEECDFLMENNNSDDGGSSSNGLLLSDPNFISIINKLQSFVGTEIGGLPLDYYTQKSRRRNGKLLDFFTDTSSSGKKKKEAVDLQTKTESRRRSILRDFFNKDKGKKKEEADDEQDSQTTKQCTVDQNGVCQEEEEEEGTKKYREESVENSIARLLVTCTNKDDDDDEEISSTKGGVLYFPKTGTKIVPERGQAVLVLLQDQHGRRDNDPYLDQFVICPVLDGTVTYLNEDFIQQV